MDKIAVLGRGFLGKEFERHGFEVLGRDRFNIKLTDPENIILNLKNLEKYDVIINCIGKSNTRWCEDKRNFNEALLINGTFVGLLSKFCSENDIKLVHISTGCLYDDTTKENTEDDFLSAHCNYTATKWVGENLCNPKRDLILRPRLYFSDIPDRNNLLCKLPKFKSFTGDKLDSLTCTSTIVGATKALLEAGQVGVFNVAQKGSASISEVAKWCGLSGEPVNTAHELRDREGLYLVNNVMDISKLLRYYTPIDIESAIRLSYAELNNRN